ncbi:MAG: methyltransferase domain-containing protein [Solirubrobacterales bacterium]|nr:methyltransferase domain-containing protein [Solirubrobacterales bacterium]MCB8915367.1 methyltransferase domain-containing protein [Thermoleophilales bacterium]
MSGSERSGDAGSAYEVADQFTSYQQSALIGTAVEVGLPNLLYGSPRNLEGITAALGTDPRGTMGLLSGLVTFGLIQREGETFSLTPNGELLADEHPESVAMIARKEWFFYKLWAEMPAAVRTGHTQTRAWRDRLENDPEQAHDFLRALDDLCRLYGGDLPELASLEKPGRLLDVGGGAGSHSANLVKAVDGLEATVLDLPGAEPVLKERHPELDFVAGDIDQPRFGRPEGEEWDYVLVSNILHDHPAEENERIIREAAGLLAPGGSLVIYEWVIDEGRTSPPGVASFTPMMVIENEGGWTWTEAEIGEWIRAAGLEPRPISQGPGPIAVIRAA